MDKFLNETNETKALQKIYSHIQDEKSKEIYMSRSMYSLSDDRVYMKNIVRNCDMSKEIYNNINEKNKLVLFGAGTWGGVLYHTF